MRPDRLYLTDIAGFRNIAVHAYFSVDWSIVWNTATREVPLLRDQVQIILDSISDDTSDRTLPNAKS